MTLPTNERTVDWEEQLGQLMLKPGFRHQLTLRREVIPVVVLPGISGSALKHRDGDGRLLPGWPVNQKGRLLRLALFGPRRKRRNLVGRKAHDPEMLEVIGGNDVDGPDHGLDGIAQLVYKRLVEQLAWADERRAQQTTQQTATNRFFRTPPHCFGYNWTGPLDASAKSLKEFVDALRTKHRRDGGRCDRVILVTHSTGGLVARHACQDAAFSSQVLGVIHAGVPHRGTPEMYYRFKSGFPRGKLIDTLIAWIASRSGREATAVLGNIPGALPLLPTMDYRTGNGDASWLRVHPHGQAGITHPEQDPYLEVYNRRDPWALLDPDNLDPGLFSNVDDDMTSLKDRLKTAQKFHTKLGATDHPNSVNLVSTGLPTAEWIDLDATDDPDEVQRIRNRGGLDDTKDRGRFETVGPLTDDDPSPWAFKLGPRSGEGDGTVPLSSATLPGVRTIAVEGITHADLLNARKTHAVVLAEVERLLGERVEAARGAA